MTTVNLFVLSNYRGIKKLYQVTAIDGDLYRLGYIDYNPEREYDTVWVKKKYILSEYTKGSKEYDYFYRLLANFNNIYESYLFKHGPGRIGLHKFHSFYKESLKTTKNPNLIKIKP